MPKSRYIAITLRLLALTCSQDKAEYWVKVVMSSTSITDKENTWQTKPTKKTADPVCGHLARCARTPLTL